MPHLATSAKQTNKYLWSKSLGNSRLALTDSLLEVNQLGLIPKGRGLVWLGSVWWPHPLHIPGREEAVGGVSVNGVRHVLVGVPGEQMHHPAGEMNHSLKGLMEHCPLTGRSMHWTFQMFPLKWLNIVFFIFSYLMYALIRLCLQANITPSTVYHIQPHTFSFFANFPHYSYPLTSDSDYFSIMVPGIQHTKYLHTTVAHLGLSSLTTVRTKDRNSQQKFIHTVGFQQLYSFWKKIIKQNRGPWSFHFDEQST